MNYIDKALQMKVESDRQLAIYVDNSMVLLVRWHMIQLNL